MSLDHSGPSSEALGIARYPGPLVADSAPFAGKYHLEKFDVPIEWYAEKWARSKGTQADEVLIGLFSRLNDPDLLSWAQLPAKMQRAADMAMRKQNRTYEETEFANGFLNSGINAYLNIMINNPSAANTGAAAAGVNAYFGLVSATQQCRLAIGDNSTAFAATQTWLVAATNKYAQALDATYPTVATQVFTARITVAGGNANYAWNEFVIDNGGGSNSTSTTLSGGSALSRAVSSQGTKTSGQTWIPTYTMTPGN